MKPEFMNNQTPLVGGKPELEVFDGPGTGTSDSIHTTLPEEGFVITADAMQMFGQEFFDRLIAAVPADPAGEEAGEEHMDVKVSDGEGYVPPEVVEFYGVEFFNKILESARAGGMPAEPMVGEESQEEAEEGFKKGGCVDGYALGGQLKDEEQRNGPLTQLAPNPVTNTPAPTSGPTQAAVGTQQSTERNLLNSQATKLQTNTIPDRPIVGGDNPQARANTINNIAQGVDSAKNGLGKVVDTLNPVSAATNMAKNIGGFFVGSDSQKAMGEFVDKAKLQASTAFPAAGEAYTQYQQDPQNQGDSGLSRLVGGIDAGIKGYVADRQTPRITDTAVQDVLKAEAARNDPNSPSYKYDPENQPVLQDVVAQRKAQPLTGEKPQQTQSQQTQTQEAAKKPPAPVNKIIEAGQVPGGGSQALVSQPQAMKRQGPATNARAEVYQPSVGSQGLPQEISSGDSNVINLSGNADWNAPNKPGQTRGAIRVDPWYTKDDRMAAMYNAGQGGQWENAQVAKQQNEITASHYKNVDANAKEEARLRELGKWDNVGKGMDEDPTKIETNASGVEETAAHRKARVMQEERLNDILEGRLPADANDPVQKSMYQRLITNPNVKPSKKEYAFMQRFAKL